MATLTYAHDRESLEPRHLQLFLKRVRKAYERPLRFFGVGEYGDETQRPHYHVVLFGAGLLPSDEWNVHESWAYGDVHLAELNEKTAAYVGGYVCKKMTAKDDPRLQGRHPEFARMSLKPGIGKRAVELIGSQLTGGVGSLAVARAGDVPSEIRVEKRKYPIGRYLRSMLRQEVGWERQCPESVVRSICVAKSMESGSVVELNEKRRKASALSAAGRLSRGKIKRSL